MGAKTGLRLCVNNCEQIHAGATPSTGDVLQFTGEIAIELGPQSQTLLGQLKMEGWWKNSFMLEFLHFDLINLEVGMDLKTLKPSQDPNPDTAY